MSITSIGGGSAYQPTTRASPTQWRLDLGSGGASGSDSVDLSQAGFAALMAGGQAPPPPPSDEMAAEMGSHMKEDNPDLFASLDSDHSGGLTAQEFKDGQSLLEAEMKKRGPPPGGPGGGPPGGGPPGGGPGGGPPGGGLEQFQANLINSLLTRAGSS